jgi:hypothetical protein
MEVAPGGYPPIAGGGGDVERPLPPLFAVHTGAPVYVTDAMGGGDGVAAALEGL